MGIEAVNSLCLWNIIDWLNIIDLEADRGETIMAEMEESGHTLIVKNILQNGC